MFHPFIQGSLTREILNPVRVRIKSCRSRCTSNLILFYAFYAKCGIMLKCGAQVQQEHTGAAEED